MSFPDSFTHSVPKAEQAHHEYSTHTAKFEVEGLSFRYSEKNYALRDMNAEIFAWPDVMRISTAIRKVNPSFPLLYNYQELITCISQT